MPARDLFHAQVCQALAKDGWTITDDPLIVQFGSLDMYIDLGAEKLIAAMRENVSIAVEIKGFGGLSVITEFHNALGQFLNYRVALEQHPIRRMLYLAVPVDAYSSFFQLPFTQTVLQRYAVALIVYDPETEEIAQWINS